MFKAKKIIYFILIGIFFYSCNKQSSAINYDNYDQINELEGFSRSVFINQDTLFIANEELGLLIYSINNLDSNLIELNLIWEDSLYFKDKGWELSGVVYLKDAKKVVVLDKFDCSYYNDLSNLFIDETDSTYLPTSFEYLQCEYDNEHQSKLTFNDDKVDAEIFTLVRYKSGYSKTDVVSIYRIEWDEFGDPYPQMIIDSLNYDVSDIHYNNNNMLISNTSEEQYEFRIYKRVGMSFNPFILDTIIVNSFLPNAIHLNDKYIFLGMANHGGLKIYDLESKKELYWYSQGFSIRDIFWDDESRKLILSCGFQGVIVLELDENVGIVNSWIINSSYAYSARIFNRSIIIVTRKGIETVYF